MNAWHVLRTSPAKEFAVEEILRRPGLMDRLQIAEVYCPVETYSIRRRGKRHPVVRGRPMVRGYLFVRCSDPFDLAKALANRGVTGVLRVTGSAAPARITEDAMKEIKIEEWEIASRKPRRGRREKRETKGPEIIVGNTVRLPRLGFSVPNAPVKEVKRSGKLVVEQTWFGAPRDVVVSSDEVALA